MLVEIAFRHLMDEEHEERRGFGGMRMDGGGTYSRWVSWFQDSHGL